MKLRLLAVGRDRSGLYAPAIEEYAGRIARYVKFELLEISEAKKNAGTPRAKEEEGESILDRLAPGDRVAALDERGETLDSRGLARRLQGWLNGGRDVALVIGGSDGLAESVLA